MAIPAVTLHLLVSQIPAALARLTAFFLQESYAFLHTFHHEGHAVFDIFNQHQQLILRFTVQAAEPNGPASGSLACSPHSVLAADAAHLVQHLVQVCTSG
jgi:hypothetical protein